MSLIRRSSAVAALVTAAAVLTATPPAQAHRTAVAERVLRVYSNNVENLVTNNADGSCTRVTGPQHLASILVDADGRPGTSGVAAPDLLIVQQVRGAGQAGAYADQLSAKFGYPAGTYRAIVAWTDPEAWGGTHHCDDPALGDLKKKQTNALVYNTRTLSLAAGDVSKYWSAGWLKPGTPYGGGAGCTLYKPPDNDEGATNQYKWKRTSAIAARFTIRATGTTVFAATMHLPEQNGANACAGAGDRGIGGTGIRLGADATSLLNASTIRLVGIDANRTGIAPATLGGFGMTGHGSQPTMGTRKIDYLFVKGAVRPSAVDHTVSGTRSNHRALYAFIDY
ncbi:hypothetical protein [Nonomuraea sp. NPDC050783]|uniref:hypothetical protein n=1 Tax=Nonomuraea sp. NPDC050783 TaxID=3154634 RepID=UPI003467556D